MSSEQGGTRSAGTTPEKTRHTRATKVIAVLVSALLYAELFVQPACDNASTSTAQSATSITFTIPSITAAEYDVTVLTSECGQADGGKLTIN